LPKPVEEAHAAVRPRQRLKGVSEMTTVEAELADYVVQFRGEVRSIER